MIDSVQRSEDWGNNCCCFSGIDRSPIIHGTSLRLEQAAVIVLDTHTLVTLHRQFVNRFVLTIPRRPSLFLHGILAASARESRIKRNARGTRYRVRFSPGSGPHGRLRLSDVNSTHPFYSGTIPFIRGPRASRGRLFSILKKDCCIETTGWITHGAKAAYCLSGSSKISNVT